MFEALGITGSGMHVHQTWMDVIADNIANVNTVRPMSQEAFRSRYVEAVALENGATGEGVAVSGIEQGSPIGRIVHDPEHPLADEDGLVRLPDVDLGEQMTTMIMAQRGFQAGAANLDRIRQSYQAAIQMGRG